MYFMLVTQSVTVLTSGALKKPLKVESEHVKHIVPPMTEDLDGQTKTLPMSQQKHCWIRIQMISTQN